MLRRITAWAWGIVECLGNPKLTKLGIIALVGLGAIFASFPELVAAQDWTGAAVAGFFSGGGSISGFAAWLAQNVILVIASFFGYLTLVLIDLLIKVASFNNFIDAPAVVTGWGVVRDLCNMFFIIALLTIAFGTVFNLEHYQYKHTLGKLLIMAVLINFSKGIAGFFIDVAQVVMLTFVNGFKDAAAANFVNGFRLSDMFNFKEQVFKDADTGNVSQSQTLPGNPGFMGALMALITILITAVVVGVYLVVFLLRIVVLWLLVVLSPLAYLASAFPSHGVQHYAEEWWQYFGKYVSAGPIMAFFLWLSLAIMGAGSNPVTEHVVKAGGNPPIIGITGIGSGDILLTFMLSILILCVGLFITSHLGVAGGDLASGALNKMQSIGTSALKGGARLAVRPAANIGKKLGYDSATAVLAGAAKIPVIGNAAIRWNSQLQKKRKEGEHRDTEGMENMTDQEAALMVQRGLNKQKSWRRFFSGEQGRNQTEYAMQHMMKFGQDNLSPEARELISKAKQAGFGASVAEKKRARILNHAKVVDPTTGKMVTREEIVKKRLINRKERMQAETELNEHRTSGKKDFDEKDVSLTKQIHTIESTILDLEAKLKDPRISADKKSELDLRVRELGREKLGLEGEQLKLRAEYTDKDSKLTKDIADKNTEDTRLHGLSAASMASLSASDQANLKKHQQEALRLKAEEARLSEEANKKNLAFWKEVGHFIDHSAGRMITVENNDVYRDRDLGQLREDFLFRAPHLIDKNEKRRITDPYTPELHNKKDLLADDTEMSYRTKRTGADLLRKLPLSALGDPQLVPSLMGSQYERLGATMINQNLEINQKGEVFRDGKKVDNDRELFALFKSAFYGINSARLNLSPRHMQLIDKSLRNMIDTMRKYGRNPNMGSLTPEEQEMIKSIPEHVREMVTRASLNHSFLAAAFQDRWS